MLFILFQLGEDRYALEAARIVEVLPLLGLKRIPQAPTGVAGIFDYRGEPVPVVDLCRLTVGSDARHCFSTRLLLVTYPDRDGHPRLLGLIVEKATATLSFDPDAFRDAGISNAATPYLGPVASDAHGLLQWVVVEKLLPTSLRDLLFRQAAEAG